MKKLVISGSSKLYERGLYWRGYFEGRGYEVIDWPRPLFEDEDLTSDVQPAPGLPLGRLIKPGDAAYPDGMLKFYRQFYKHLDQTDALFVMNEDKNGIEGYIGANTFAEIAYSVVNILNRGHKIEINLLKMPAKELNCYEEIKFWLDQDLLHIYRRPTGKKAAAPVSEEAAPQPIAALASGEKPTEVQTITEQPVTKQLTEGEVVENPPVKTGLFNRGDRMIDITTCSKRCLSTVIPEVREYFKMLSPEFPAWLLKYIAAPEMQRLIGVNPTCGLIHTSIYNYKYDVSTLDHSIGVALVIWHFTHDKKQTLAGLFHDIASPAFKHSIDYMNGDAETQESTEDRTAQIIRDSRTITKLLKRDNILPSEVSDYHLYPIADNDLPNLSADRLEYTLMHGYFNYNVWNFDQVKRFYDDITIIKNERGIDELAFQTPELAAEFTTENLSLAAHYHDERARATFQFLADMIQSMINGGYLTVDDLYVMSEREIIDWILSCGDKSLAEAFRNFQRTTDAFASGIAKKNCYCTSVKSKIRYIVPLVKSDQEDKPSKRITDLDKKVRTAVQDYLDTKQPKYVGFDFEFKPYTE